MKNKNEPAFPQHGWSSNPKVVAAMQKQQGLTMRDYFAGQALSALVNQTYIHPDRVAADAYAIADEMLKRRQH